jgi:transmembrane sensor
MIKERLAELLSRKVSGEASAGELQELEHWLQAHPEDQYFADLLLNYWTGQSPAAETAETSTDQHFAHILEMAANEQEDNPPIVTPQKNNIVRLVKRLAIAACVAGIIAVPVWLLNKKESPTLAADTFAKKEVVAEKGARTKMILPDGTQVWLNSDSKLEYDQSFNDTVREVTLEGEAYFDVVKNPKRPFIVHTSSIDIRVLGTAFNVKSYAREKTIETTLIHGSVEVTRKNEPQLPKIILRPKEKLVFNKQEDDFDNEGDTNVKPVINKNIPAIAVVPLAKGVADTSLKETSWVYNRLDFDGDTFSELAVKMERWYNVKIIFKNERLANMRLGGAFEDEGLEEALKALQLITKFTYKINNNNEVEINK